MSTTSLSKWLSILFVIGATITSFAMVFYGLDFKDSFFLGSLFLYGGDVDIMRPLTQGLYLAINRVIGDYIIAYRIINWFFFYAAYCIIALFTREHMAEKNYSMWLWAVSVIMIPLLNTNVFNGNSLTVFFLSTTFVSFYYYSKNKTIWLLGVVISIVLLILSRFPNIVIIPILLIASPFICCSRVSFVKLLGTLLISIIVYSIICIAICGGFENGLYIFRESFIGLSESDGANHSFSLLLSNYCQSFKDIVSNIKFLAVVAIIPFLVFGATSRRLSVVIAFFFVGMQVLFLVVRVHIISDVLNYELLVYFYSLLFITVFILFIVSLIHHCVSGAVWALLPLLFSLCAASGSNSGLFLLGGPLFAFVPWVLYVFFSQVKEIKGDEIFIVIVALLGLGIASACYVRNGMSVLGIVVFVSLGVVSWFGKSILKQLRISYHQVLLGYDLKCLSISACLLLVLSASLSIYVKQHVSFHDKPISELTCQLDFLPQCKGINTNVESRLFVESILNEYKQLIQTGDKVVFYGLDSALFSYVTGIGMIKGVDFAQDGSDHNLRALSMAISDKPFVIFCPENPAFSKYSLSDYPSIADFFTQSGYLPVNHKQYTVFSPLR